MSKMSGIGQCCRVQQHAKPDHSGTAMTSPDILNANRVILCHFDSYSAALLFARWGRCMLAPEPLPESAVPMVAPADVTAFHDAEAVKQAAVARYGLNADELVRMDDFDQWMQTDAGPIRVHVLRFSTFEAPAPLIAAHDGVFKPISELRGSAMLELNLLREVFNLVMAGSGR